MSFLKLARRGSFARFFVVPHIRFLYFTSHTHSLSLSLPLFSVSAPSACCISHAAVFGGRTNQRTQIRSDVQLFVCSLFLFYLSANVVGSTHHQKKSSSIEHWRASLSYSTHFGCSGVVHFAPLLHRYTTRTHTQKKMMMKTITMILWKLIKVRRVTKWRVTWKHYTLNRAPNDQEEMMEHTETPAAPSLDSNCV